MPSGRRCLWRVSTGRLYVVCGVRTLDIGNGLIEDRLEGLGALELLLDLGDDGLGELALLPLLDLALVADPRVEDALGLVRDGGLLLELVGLGLELGGLLRVVSAALRRVTMAHGCAPWRAVSPAVRHTLETSNRVLVMSMTPPRSWTLSMRSLT